MSTPIHRNTLGRRGFLTAASAAAVAALVGCGSRQDDSPVAPRTGPSAAPSPETPHVLGYSTGASVLWGEQESVQRTMDAVRDGGATSVRVDVSWTFAEPYRGQFDWAPSDKVIDAAVASGLTILATITNTPTWAAIGRSSLHTTAPRDPEEYAAFAGAVAERYRGRVEAYEVWNEPNGRIFFAPDPDPVLYTAMLRAAYRTIKAADPDAVVVAGATGNTASAEGLVDSNEFVAAMYAAGAQGSFDALSHHPYDFGMPIGDATVYPNSPMQQMIRMHRAMELRGDGEKKIWITEYGAPTTAVDPDTQADLIVGSVHQWSEVSFGGPFFVYTLRDADSSSTDSESQFGVLRDSFEAKPAYNRLSDLAAAGLPVRDIARQFEARTGSSLGRPLSPVFPVDTGFGRQYDDGSMYKTPRGWFTCPPAVAEVARSAGLIPAGPFADGYQDFMSPNGVRVFSGAGTGTHIVAGAILGAWRPDLGFPVSGEYDGPRESRIVDFQNGRITWKSTTGPLVSFSS